MTDAVELTLPVHADLIVLARFAAATIGSRADFDVEEIEDFRLAVEELCLSVVDGSSDGRIEIQFLRDEEQVEVACSFRPGTGTGTGTGAAAQPDGSDAERRNELSDLLVEALVDEHGQEVEGGHRKAWLRKRRAPRPH
jgi:anti-sigma regulatory factor (Ser/Thr protein kinase)